MAAVRAVAGLVERMLACDGPLPALCEEQRRLARIVAEGLDAPPRQTPLVTFAQAAAGTGKTVALLAPVMALATLQKRQCVPANRALLSTWTNHLTRQIEGDDAPRVSRALEALGYPRVSVAVRAGRRQFVDHDRVERALDGRPGDRGAGDATALEALLRFPTFIEAEHHGVFVPPGLAADALCLTPRSTPEAASAFAACRLAAAAADVVITNHALVLTDCRLRGRVLGAPGVGQTLVFDEADALPDAARSIADEGIDLTLARDVNDALGADARGPLDALERLLAHQTRSGRHRLLANSARREDILALVARIGDALARAAPSDEDVAEEAENLLARLAHFDACARSGDAIAAIAAGPTPGLAVVHREPVRVLRRLIEMTPATFFVSATLGVPQARPNPNEFLRTLGIGPGTRGHAAVRFAAWANLEPRRHGEMQFRFADRSTPGPFKPGCEPPEAHPAHLDYVARAITEARASGRVLVLCTSYDLVEELAARVTEPVVQARGARLASCIDAFRDRADAVLLTPAAWTGISLTGLVEHVLIPRIPFRPDEVRDEARRTFLATLGLPQRDAARIVARDRHAHARRKLAQGIGRGIRGPRERCTVWLLDPRFPLPAAMARAIGGPGQGRATPCIEFIHCIPARFRTGRRPAVATATIHPL